ncbi:MAG: hypothetical protein AMXMBFR82_41200 [Candidatus Hydrogenedentota bacterium]
MPVSTRIPEQRIPPVRGIVTTHNQWGRPFNLIDLKRWLRLNRIVFNAEKVDILADARTFQHMPALLEYASELGLRVSLRVACTEPVPDISAWKDLGLLDVFVTAPLRGSTQLEPWLNACRDTGLPCRVEVAGPAGGDSDPVTLAKTLMAESVTAVNVMAFDPFVNTDRASNGEQTAATVGSMNALARAVSAEGTEVNLVHLPFCAVEVDLRPHVVNSRQFWLDHQQYNKGSYDLAVSLYRNIPAAVGKILLILLARSTFQRTFVDAVLLRLLLHSRLIYGWSVALHKLTGHLRNRLGKPRETAPTLEAHAQNVEKLRERERRMLGPICAECSLRRICDRILPDVRRVLPDMAIEAVPGELVVSPMHFALAQPKHFDIIDAERMTVSEGAAELVKEANALVENRAPDRQIMPYEYTVEGAPWEHLEGGVRWHSITNTEKLSSPLGFVEPPFTISVTFGGGIAEYIGLSFGRHCKLLCPMEGYRHILVLHVDRDGHYVLLRDGKQVRPVEFEGMFYVPLRLGGRLEPRISIWNIDAQIVTQFVKIWDVESVDATAPPEVKYSIIVVNSRYARRLQAMLRSIAHQEGIDIRKIEVIIAYIPGLDATDDLIDSMNQTYPDLRILRSPFPAQNANSKGFMINESAQMASGEWIVLMDADIVIAPDMFARIEAVAGENDFIAADGRLMLSKETTAKVLMGEAEPWRQWQELVNSASEYRYREAKGVPVGFFQCFKRAFMDKVKYAELDHFEGADMWFGMALQDTYGKETRLSGSPVLHLDHGGSQWYGTTKHF